MRLQCLQDPRGLSRRACLSKLPPEVVKGRRNIAIVWFLPRRYLGDSLDVTPYVALSWLGWTLGGSPFAWDYICGELGREKSRPRLASLCVGGQYPQANMKLPGAYSHSLVDGDHT